MKADFSKLRIIVDYSHIDLAGGENLVDGTVTMNGMSLHKPSLGSIIYRKLNDVQRVDIVRSLASGRQLKLLQYSTPKTARVILTSG